MMRFPPRLKWDLTKVRIAQKLFGASGRPVVLHLDLADFAEQSEVPADANAEPSSSPSSRDSDVLEQVRENTAPVVWIGGDTPLRHPLIGQITRDIVNLGRTVFIEADGTLLRRRIHEFKPESRIYLVLPLNGLEAAHGALGQHAGNFRATIESIRTAKLSGFHICAQTTIFADIQLTELRELAALIQKLDIDGWIQTRPPVSATQPTEEKLTAARKLIPNPDWRKFSEHLSLRGKMSLKENLLLGAPHAKSACDGFLNLWVAPSGATLTSQEEGASAPEGQANIIEDRVRSVGSDSPNQRLPTQEESIRAS
jgi:hypothetical protein